MGSSSCFFCFTLLSGRNPLSYAFSLSSSSPLLSFLYFLSFCETYLWSSEGHAVLVRWGGGAVWQVLMGVLTSPLTPASCERICFSSANITEPLWHFPFWFRETLKEFTVPAVTWRPFCKEHMALPSCFTVPGVSWQKGVTHSLLISVLLFCFIFLHYSDHPLR